MRKHKAVFLDRDGTINADKPYLYKITDFEFLPGAREALSLLSEAGYRLVIVTNQSGVARGYYGKRDVEALHDWLRKTLAQNGVNVAGIYYCPHHPQGGVEAYRRDCGCRKPGLELFYRAASELELDVESSIAIGDRLRDLQICQVSGCGGYLLGGGESGAILPLGVKRVSNLLAAARTVWSALQGNAE
jgi:D-glycero-D-manno-heptose 1,7-bisphosphate phosphatase